MFRIALIVTLAWGALAFGAEYSWAYAPLLTLAITTAILGLRAGRGTPWAALPVVAALGAVFLAGIVQLLPLPRSTVASLSHARVAADFQGLYEAQVTLVPDASREANAALLTFSVRPSRTVLGLAFLAACTALFAGCVRAFGSVGLRSIAVPVVVLGVVVAFVELAQRASGSDVLYGFWHAPAAKRYHSAPFVNYNHGAGWLLMVLALTVGHWQGLAARLRPSEAGLRRRLLWLSSPDASRAPSAVVAMAVMGVAVITLASRSGFACLALLVLFSVAWAVARQRSVSRKAVAAMCLVSVLLLALSISGAKLLAGRIDNADWATLDGRLRVWQDTLTILRDAVVTGTGFNTYGVAMMHYQTVNDGFRYVEAHNDYLQLASEGGLLLGVPMVVAVAFFIREVRNRFRERQDDTSTYWLRAGAVMGLCVIAVQELSDFTLQMPGAAVLFVVLAAIAVHRPNYLGVRGEDRAGGGATRST